MNGRKSISLAVALFLFVAAIRFIFFPDYAYAASSSIGVSPSQISNEILTPGAEVETKLTVSRATASEEVVANVEISGQEIVSWISFPEGNRVTLEKGTQRKEISVKIKVPQNAAYKKYEGNLRFTVTQQTQGQVNIVPGVRVDIRLTVTDKVTESIKVQHVQVKDSALNDPYGLTVKVKNLGNTAAAPTKLVLQILDINENQLRSLEYLFSEKVAPFSEKDYEIFLQDQSVLPIGEYWARVTIYSEELEIFSDKFSFRITEARPSVSVSTTLDGKGAGINILGATLVFVGIITLVGLIVLIIVFRRKNNNEETS